MKKTIQLTILLAALMSMGSTKAFAYDIAVENEDGVMIYYKYYSDVISLEVVSGNKKYSGIVVIPEEVTYNEKKLSVTSIGNNAFYNCSSLTSVTIPNSVTTINRKAFYNCI
ncbi:MAG: leucine-rich repeat protein [Bacteroidaceae bacterium]|nr:leucine-rich repeat protein [Bacteroidaceae bacterium]